MSEQSTGDLVQRALRGEQRAFESLVRLHLRAAYAVALAGCGDPADAEDLAQEGFVVAFQQLATCRDPERFAGWLLQIVRNRALNRSEQRRSRTRARELWSATVSSSAWPEEQAGHQRRRLLEALALLPVQQREVLLLHDLEEWTHPEIAAALGVSEVNSRQLLFVARRKMRERLPGEASEVNRGS